MTWTGNSENKVPNFVQFGSEMSDVKKSVNRAEEQRRDKDTQKDVSIGLLDIDTAIVRQLEKFQLTVLDNGQSIKVPTNYASPEKWKSIQKDGFMRDYQGKIILPALVFSRTSSEKNKSMMLFNRYLTYTVMKKYDVKNRYTPFNILIGKNVPVNDIYGMTMPDHMIFTYHFIVWAEYQTQVNKIVERINFEAEDYWGDKYGYRFQVKIDSISHTIQLATDQDRMVKAEFDMQAFGYIVPDVIDKFDGKTNTTQKWMTPKKIIMGVEVVNTGFNENNVDDNSEKIRNQNYPNLRKDEPIPTPPVSFVNPVAESIPGTHLVSTWVLPPPFASSAPGSLGQISFSNEYYYIYTDQWRRAPKTQVDSLSLSSGEKKWLSFDRDYIYILGNIVNRISMNLFNTFI
jgi:hypothetical protein